jgi:hypothetical protein
MGKKMHENFRFPRIMSQVNGSIIKRSFKADAVLMLGTGPAPGQNFILGRSGTGFFAPDWSLNV